VRTANRARGADSRLLYGAFSPQRRQGRRLARAVGARHHSGRPPRARPLWTGRISSSRPSA
jgi:hypothetical protein